MIVFHAMMEITLSKQITPVQPVMQLVQLALVVYQVIAYLVQLVPI